MAQYWNLNIVGMQEEIKQVETLITSTLFEDDAQKEYYEFQLLIELLEDLYVVKLSRMEVDYVSGKIKSFKNDEFIKFLRENDIAAEDDPNYTDNILGELLQQAKKYMKFYNIAAERNSELLSNTVKSMRKEGKKVAALITGGYHSSGLTDIMQKKGLSYIILMPKTFEDKARPYVTILTKKAQPHKRNC